VLVLLVLSAFFLFLSVVVVGLMVFTYL